MFFYEKQAQKCIWLPPHMKRLNVIIYLFLVNLANFFDIVSYIFNGKFSVSYLLIILWNKSIVKYFIPICLKGLRNPMKYLSLTSQPSAQDLESRISQICCRNANYWTTWDIRYKYHSWRKKNIVPDKISERWSSNQLRP